MRSGLRAGTLTALLLLPALARADDAADCKTIVEKAITAAGGADKLTQLTAATWRTRSSSAEKNSKATLAGQLPDKFRAESDADANGKVVHRVRVLNGDQGWVQTDGKTEPMSPAAVAASKLTFYHKSLAWILLPLRDPALRLTPLGEADVNGRPAVGIKVERADRPAVRMFFDRTSGLPVKSETTGRDRATGRETTLALIYSEHRAVNGVMVPGKTTTLHDGRPFGVLELLEFKPEKALDPKLFQAP